MKRVFAHIGFSFALALIILNFLNVKWALAAAVAAGALFVVSLLIPKTRKAVAVPLCLFTVMLAALMFSANYYLDYQPQAQLSGKTVKANFYVVDLEQNSPSGYSYIVKTKAIEGREAPQNIKLRLYTYTPLDYENYEILQGELKLKLISDDAYNSYGYYAENIFLHATAKGDILQSGEIVISPLKLVLDFRQHLKNVFATYIGGDEGALALAVLTGNKSDMSASVYDDFKAGGLAHLVAVSGLHLMALCGTVYYLLRRLSVRVVPRAVISAVFVLFYIVLSGFAPSMIRAGLMMLIFLLGKCFKQKSDSLNSLGLAAFLVCFFNPFAVTHSGTMLSYTAVLGILTLNAPLRRYFKADNIKNKLFRFAADGVILSLSIFIATLPVMLFFFRQASLIGILISFIAVPLAQVLLITSFLFIPIYKVGIVSAAVAFVIRLFAGMIIKIAARAAGAAFSLIYLDYSYIALAVAVVFLIFGIGFILRRKKALRVCALISVIAFCIVTACGASASAGKTYIRAISGSRSTAYIVYDDNYALAIGVAENSQYYTAKQIIKANGLSLVLVVDNSSGNYSESLAKNCNSGSFISAKAGKLPKNLGECKNISSLSEFDIDLWQGVNVKYINNEAVITVNGNDYHLDNFSQPLEYDYVINAENGHYRRLNQWQD